MQNALMDVTVNGGNDFIVLLQKRRLKSVVILAMSVVLGKQSMTHHTSSSIYAMLYTHNYFTSDGSSPHLN